MQIVICKGIPASGKSTWAKQFVKENQDWKRINKDELRLMIDNGKWSKTRENFIEQARNAMIQAALSQGYNVIVDDTNLAEKHEVKIRELAKLNKEYGDGDVEVSIKWFPISLEEALLRNKYRRDKVPDDVITSMFEQYKKAGGPESVPFKPPQISHYDLPPCIICDLDGTLCLFDGLRGPYQTELCEFDRPNNNVRYILECADRDGIKIFLFSGRENKFRSKTLQWLCKHTTCLNTLYMRSDGDSRDDAIVKRELYEQHIERRYNVMFVLDDRDKVVKMWREQLRLPCFQVNWGNF